MVDESSRPPRTIESWDERYVECDPATMPWFHAELDPDVERALARWFPGPGRVLDLGTGPGTQAIELARRGYEVVGTDISPAAISKAIVRAQGAGVAVDFRVDDVLRSELRETFEVVFDRGCFHVFEPALRGAYVETLSGLLDPGGLLLLKTFSYLQPGDFGPQRLRPEEVDAVFGSRFERLSVEHCVYQGNNTPLPKALFFVLRKTVA